MGNNRVDSWDLLARDASQRLRKWAPVRVGVLNERESDAFIRSYTAELSEEFSEDSLGVLRSLSGGNLREMIRIAYQAFEEARGALNSVTPSLMLQSARKSGTIEDHVRLALEMIDQTFSESIGIELTTEPEVGIRASLCQCMSIPD